MKKKVQLCLWLCLMLLLCLASCANRQLSADKENLSSENTTSETKNAESYTDNYREISEQTIRVGLGDDIRRWVGSEIKKIKMEGGEGYEGCIAIVTLTNVGKTGEIKEGYTPVYLRIDRILIKGDETETLKEGMNVICQDNVIWNLLDDGTYKIRLNQVDMIPLAEIGARYVVSLSKTEDNIEACCISFPFDNNNCYVETKAVGDERYRHISAETLWYFDINLEYYYDFWNDNSELLEFNKSLGNDVFDKKSVFFGMDMEGILTE